MAFDEYGRGPLEAAIERGDAEITLALLRQGADPKGRSADGESLAALAMDRNEDDIVELLARYASGRARPSPTRAPLSPATDPLDLAPAQPPAPPEPETPRLPPNVKRRSILG